MKELKEQTCYKLIEKSETLSTINEHKIKPIELKMEKLTTEEFDSIKLPKFEEEFDLDRLRSVKILEDVTKEKTSPKPIIKKLSKKLRKLKLKKETTEDDILKIRIEMKDEYTLDLFYDLEISEDIIKSYVPPKTSVIPSKNIK